MRAITTILLMLFFLPSLARSQPTSGQEWEFATISGDAITIACMPLNLPDELGRYLIDDNPTSVCGEFCQTLRSPHEAKVSLEPQTGTADTLSSIAGCTEDGAKVILAPQDVGDSITVQHSEVPTANQIYNPAGESYTMVGPYQSVFLVRRNSVWILLGGTGSGTSDLTAHETFQNDKVVAGLDGTANAAQFRDTAETAAIRIYSNATEMVIDCVESPDGAATPCANREIFTASIFGKMIPDGLNCEHNFTLTLGDKIYNTTITCAKTNGALFQGKFFMPDRWDGVTLKASIGIHTDEGAPSGDLRFDWAGYCIRHGESNNVNAPGPTSMFVDLDGLDRHDEAIGTTAANIPVNNCTAAGKRVLWLGAVVNTTGYSADNPLTHHITDVIIEYGANAFTD